MNCHLFSLALLVNGVAGVIGTSLGGVFSDKITSKRWLIISISIFIIMMLILNQILAGTVILLLIGLFIWNIMQWSTNPAIQSGIIEHVEGDTSQVMSWNMSSLNAGIGFVWHRWWISHVTFIRSSCDVYKCNYWIIRPDCCYHFKEYSLC